MRRIVLSCFAGVFVGLVIVLLPLAIFQPDPTMSPTMLGQRGTAPFTDTKGTGNATSSVKEFGGVPGAPDNETLRPDQQFSASNPVESLGLTSLSMMFAVSVFMASRRTIRHGKVPTNQAEVLVLPIV
jgi:hypothetical protein